MAKPYDTGHTYSVRGVMWNDVEIRDRSHLMDVVAELEKAENSALSGRTRMIAMCWEDDEGFHCPVWMQEDGVCPECAFREIAMLTARVSLMVSGQVPRETKH